MAFIHLYDPNTDTHYRNGGMISPEHPKPEGMEWVDGKAPEGSEFYRVPTPQTVAEAMLAELPAAMRAKYYSAIDNIRSAINNDEWDVVGLLLNGITTDTPEEAEALAAISEVLGGGND